MNTKNVQQFFGDKAAALKQLGVYRQQWDYWKKNGIPYIWQIAIEHKTDGKLVAKHKRKSK